MPAQALLDFQRRYPVTERIHHIIIERIMRVALSIEMRQITA